MCVKYERGTPTVCAPFRWDGPCTQGFLPSAMKNYLSLLGWNDGTEKEIFTEDELNEAFDLRRVVKSSAVFDMTKLK